MRTTTLHTLQKGWILTKTSVVLNWFQINEMKSNNDKLLKNHDNVSLNLGNESIETSSTVELLGIKLDKNLDFNEHVRT